MIFYTLEDLPILILGYEKFNLNNFGYSLNQEWFYKSLILILSLGLVTNIKLKRLSKSFEIFFFGIR